MLSAAPWDASNQNYTTTVIEYSSAAQLPAAQTLAGLFSKVTLKQDSHLPNAGTLRLILGSTFTSLTGSSGGSGSNGSAGVSEPRYHVWRHHGERQPV